MTTIQYPPCKAACKSGSRVTVLPWLCIALAAWILTGCGAPKSREDIVGTYTASVPADGSFVRNYMLVLQADSSCRFSREIVRDNKKRTLEEKGTWTNTAAKVTITVIGMKTSRKSTNQLTEVISFNWKSGKLVCSEWDRQTYGEEGLGTFTKTNIAGGTLPK